MKEYRKVLLLAHKRAHSGKQGIQFPPSPITPLRILNYNAPYNYGMASDSSPRSPKFITESAASETDQGIETPLIQNMSQELTIRAEQENEDSYYPKLWTCSTCVDAKFSCKFTRPTVFLVDHCLQSFTRIILEP